MQIDNTAALNAYNNAITDSAIKSAGARSRQSAQLNAIANTPSKRDDLLGGGGINGASINGANAARQNGGLNKEDAALKETTDAFEAFMVKSLLDIAMNPDSKNTLFPSDAGDKIYKSMYNDTMSRALSGGLGFSELLFDYLKERSAPMQMAAEQAASKSSKNP